MEYRFTSIDDWYGCERVNFTLNGRESLVVRPKDPLPGNPTVWRAEFFSAFDTVDRALLAKGWHLCYHKVSNMYGCPESIVMMKEFYDFITTAFGLSKKPILFGFSRGGLYSVNFAAAHPDCVGGLYLDAPVMDIRSWPCRMENSSEKLGCMRWYGLNEKTLAEFKENPLDKAETIVNEKIPVIIVAGGADESVPYHDNGAIFAHRMRELGGTIETIVKPECGHHPHSLDDPSPVVAFLEKYRL